jgi:hypothetical protein
MTGELFYGIPELMMAVGVLVLLLLAIEAGYRAGDRVPSGWTDSAKAPVLAISGAIFGLLALLLGFTFSMSLNRFEQRKELVVQEANAIGTTYLRARLLPQPEQSAMVALLRTYVDTRLDFFNFRQNPEQFKATLNRTGQLQDELWSHAASVLPKTNPPVTAGLLIQSLNEVIDLHTKRLTAMENHVPEPVLLLLVAVAIMAGLTVGYACGLQNRRHFFSTMIMALLIAMVITIILDLDRPSRGLIQVSQNSMIRLRDSIKNDGH